MANYQTGTVTGVADLVDKLCIFVAQATTAWTVDENNPTTRQATVHNGSCYVSFRWDATGGSMYQLAIYQSLGFTPGALPHAHPDDSGNGSTTSPATTGRRVNFTNGQSAANAGPYTYYFFANGGSATPTIYVVVMATDGVYRHFGFGHLVKAHDYTGGEFCYGHVWTTTTTLSDDPLSVSSQFLLDGRCTASTATELSNQGTVHLEGLAGQVSGGKWGVCYTPADGVTGNDRQTSPKARLQLMGAARCGLWGYALAWARSSQLSAHKILIPIPVLWRDAVVSPDTWKWLGEMPDIALFNMAYFTGGDEIAVASDTYMVFPWVRKQYTNGNVEESWNAGVAYKKVA